MTFNKELSKRYFTTYVESRSELSAILIHKSRTGHERHYKILHSHGNATIDITPTIAVLANQATDTQRGTIVRHGGCAAMDGIHIASEIKDATEWRGRINVL